MSKILFISSSGGHLAELLQMKKIIDKYDSYIITEKNDSTIKLSDTYKDKVAFLVQTSRKPLFKFIFKFGYNIIKSIFLYLKIRPEIIVTTGSSCVIPMCYIGKIMGSKVVFIESYARVNTLSMTGKHIQKKADIFFVQHEELHCKTKNTVYVGGLF